MNIITSLQNQLPSVVTALQLPLPIVIQSLKKRAIVYDKIRGLNEVIYVGEYLQKKKLTRKDYLELNKIHKLIINLL